MNKKPETKFIFLLLAAAFFTYIFHEFGHWIVGEALGNKMIMTLNFTYPKKGTYIHDWDTTYILIGGPFFTILQALAVFYLILKYNKLFLYPFLFFAFFIRFFGLVFAFSIEDEAKISSSLQIGTFTVPLIVVLILSLLIWRGSVLLKLDIKFNLFCFAYSTIFLIIVVNLDKLLF